MAGTRSLKGYIQNRFYNNIYQTLSEHVLDNPARLDVKSHKIEEPDEAELIDMHIKTVYTSDSHGDNINLDVVVEAELKIAETIRRNRETSEAEQWFRIPCSADLSDGDLKSIVVGEPEVYSKKARSRKRRLTNDLVPVIAKDNFDSVAKAFLNDYYPEALVEPMPVDVEEVVRRMGLDIEYVSLTNDLSIFGKMVFNDCEVDIWCDDKHIYESIEVKRGTILVDRNVYFMRNLGTVNNTVIHECFHWHKHRKYHWLRNVYDTDSDAHIMVCPVFEKPYLSTKEKWSDWDWMEWQANGVAPRILMPKEQTKVKIEQLISKYEVLFGKGKKARLEVLQGVVKELASFFGVSVVSAKIRMMDLGYKDAEGVFTYIDDHYISSYAFNVESKDSMQSFCISLDDSFHQYYTNGDFRNIINSGKFVYIDSHHVLDNSKYVGRLDNGTAYLTDYAKLHIDECCLRFDLIANTKARPEYDRYYDSVMFRDATIDYSRIPNFNQDKHNLELIHRDEDLKKFYYEIADEFIATQDVSQTFSQLAWQIIRRKGINKQAFQDRTLLSTKMYERIENDELSNPKLETVMAICVGLNVGGIQGEKLLACAGYQLNDTLLHIIYKKLLFNLNGHTIYDCNKYLEAYNFKPLGDVKYAKIK